MWILSFIYLISLIEAFQVKDDNSTYKNTSIIQPEINARNFNLKGVNIGGWLVLEPYITPSLFLAFNETNKTAEIPIDEYRFCETLGKEEASKRLQKHWNSFYNESDFKRIKDMGLNMVRIPIGYWSFEMFEDDPYVKGAQEYLDKALEWCENNDLKVWIDLHGVPGSQNGFDNSGFRDIGYPGWLNSTKNVDLSYKVLRQMYSKYGSEKYKDTIIGLEVLNEPLSTEIPIEKIEDFYRNTYKDARNLQEVNNTIVFHDAFKGIGYWNDFLDKTPNNITNITSDNYNIMIDHHHYEIFDAGALNMTIKDHLNSIKGYSSSIKKELSHHPAIVGEWSAALTDCTLWLNGVGLGSRFEGSAPYTNDPIGSCKDINNFDRWTEDRKKAYRKYIEIQLDQYESQMNGWIFWCFKTENAIEWDLSKLVEYELFPQPLDNRTYIIDGEDVDSSDDDETIAESSAINIPPSFTLVLTMFLLYIDL